MMAARATTATPDGTPALQGSPRPRRRVTKAEALEAIRANHGLMTATARALNCHRATLYRLIERHPDLQEAIDEARDMTTDVAEAALFRAIRQGQPWAVQFYLKTQGKTRGYVERQEVDNLRDVDLSTVPTEQLQAWLQRK